MLSSYEVDYSLLTRMLMFIVTVVMLVMRLVVVFSVIFLSDILFLRFIRFIILTWFLASFSNTFDILTVCTSTLISTSNPTLKANTIALSTSRSLTSAASHMSAYFDFLLSFFEAIRIFILSGSDVLSTFLHIFIIVDTILADTVFMTFSTDLETDTVKVNTS